MKTEQDPFIYRALLVPHRSLSPRGFMILMGALCLISFTAGLIFALKGAWPVFGFFGLEIAIIYWAFRRNYADSVQGEAIELTRDHLRIYYKRPGKAQKMIEMNPFWVRLQEIEHPFGKVDLFINCKRDKYEIASFLSSSEKQAFAKILSQELTKAKTSVV